MSESKALAKTGNEQITSLAQLEEKYKGQPVNLVLPKIEIGQIPVGSMLAVRSVMINKASKADVYDVSGNKALTKYSLDRIAAAAGITWISEKRIDDRSHPHYCEFEVRGRVVDFDGTVREAYGTKTYDMRADADGAGTPGRQRKACKTEKQLNMALEFMTELCASKAKNRAVSAILGIKRSYSPAELDRPFIIPKLVPDTSNPMAQQAVLAGMVGATEALFSRPEPKVVDGRVLEKPVERVTVADDDDDLPEAGDETRVDQETGELDALPPIEVEETTKDVKVSLAQLYKHATDNQIPLKDWNKMVFEATKKKDYGEMNAADLAAVAELVEARIANQ